MSKRFSIEPVSRIEGGGKIVVILDEAGQVDEARLQMKELKGFEKFCEGRMLWEMPVITTRVCGICSVSHHLASVKACEDILKVEIPSAARKLRELLNLAQLIYSHSAHFYFFAAADFILLTDQVDPAERSFIGLMEVQPELMNKAIEMRRISTELMRIVGGRVIHPVSVIPGGMSKAISHEERFALNQEVKSGFDIALDCYQLSKQIIQDFIEHKGLLTENPSMQAGLTSDGNLEFYDGNIRYIDPDDNIVVEYEPHDYLDFLGEEVVDWSYHKIPYLLEQGYPQGTYLTGPLARLNISDNIPTAKAGNAFREFKSINQGKPVQGKIYQHYARFIEVLYAFERASLLLADDDIVSKDFRIPIERKGGQGIGVVEAPRGLLIHDYQADDYGHIEKVNLIVATAHNGQQINQSLKTAAIDSINDSQLSKEAANYLKMVVRSYDPCLTCATHTIDGDQGLAIELRNASGKIVDVYKGE